MAMTQLLSYGFTTVENPLSNAGNFTIQTNFYVSNSLKVIAGDLCEETAGAGGAAFWSGSVIQTGDSWPADQYSELTLTTWDKGATVSTALLGVRMIGTGASATGYYLVLSGAATPTYVLTAEVSGTTHALVLATNTTVAQGDVWRLTVVGNVISWSRNGTAVASFTDTNNYITAANSPGFGLVNPTTVGDTQTSLWAGGGNQAATPTFSPVAGSYTGAQTITISSTTAGGTIYYTTDGTTPTHSSSSIVNGGTITVSKSATVNAFVSVTDFADSATGSAVYTIALNTPTFSPVAGTYASAQTVTITSTGVGEAIYYTTDGSTPTSGSTLYTGPITVSVSETVKAIAILTGYANSAIGSAAYVIGGGGAVGWSPVDSRVAVFGFGPAANVAVIDAQGNEIFSATDPPYSGNSQTSSNSAIPGKDSRVAGAPKDSRVNVPMNSRVNPDNGGIEE